MQRTQSTTRSRLGARRPKRSRRHTLIALALAAGSTAIAVPAPDEAAAQQVLDQSYECNNTFAQILFFAPVGQSFVPETPTLSAIEVHLLQFNTPGPDTITMNLRSGSLTGPIVATGSHFIQPPPAEVWLRYDFTSPPVFVTPGSTYVIELAATNPSWGWGIATGPTPSCPDYPGGVALGNFARASLDGRDWSFRTYTYCGNGVVDPALGETCDAGAANGGPGSCCTAACTIAAAGTSCRASAGDCDLADTCDGVAAACPNVVRPAGELCRPSAGECDLADTCNGVAGGCPDQRAASGTACGDDGLPCTLDVCNGGVACTHPAGNAGAICRAAAGACDVAETCSGASSTCPGDQVKPDTDLDGECDDQDPCTSTGSQTFASSKPKPKLVLGQVNTDTVPGNDKLTISGAFSLPAPLFFLGLTPHLSGARVVVEAADGSRPVDVAVPAGLYSTALRRGWKLSGSGRSWSYVDRSGSPVNGITKLLIHDRSSATAPRRLQVTVVGAKGSYPVVAGDAPLQAIVTLGGPAAATAGACAESAFLPGECAFNGNGKTVTCKP